MYSQMNTNTSHIQLIYIYLFGLQLQCFLYTCIFKYHKPAYFEVSFGVYNQEINKEYNMNNNSKYCKNRSSKYEERTEVLLVQTTNITQILTLRF